MIAILQTKNFYPIEPYATKIAEPAMALYNASDNGPVELILDDVDLFIPEMENA